MRYTYKGKDYPKELNIKHQEVFTTLSKDPLDITRRRQGLPERVKHKASGGVYYTFKRPFGHNPT